jgi:predicted transglutaminase-like cysteine proteinase
MRTSVLGTMALAITMLAAPAFAEPLPESSRLATANATLPTKAYEEFCQRYPAECAVDLQEEPEITLTPAVWQTLDLINMQVNLVIKPMTDQNHWGVVDRWDLPDDGQGDCEDYQLLKRRMLAEQGLPRRAMRMTVVLDENGEGHAILLVRTDRGDFVLDNKRDEILPWFMTGYKFIMGETTTASWKMYMH